MVPLEFMVHATGLVPFPVVEYEKFPLLWANAAPDTDIAISTADLKIFFIFVPPAKFVFCLPLFAGQASESHWP